MAVTWLKKKYRSVDNVKTRNKPSSANSGHSAKNVRKFRQEHHPNDKPVVMVLFANGKKRILKQEDYYGKG